MPHDEQQTTAGPHGAFWDRHRERLTDPARARTFAAELARVRAIDAVVNALDDHRLAAGLSKTDLARAIGADPSTVRRLLTAPGGNPTLGTVAEVAAALGLKPVLVPMDADERRELAAPLTLPT